MCWDIYNQDGLSAVCAWKGTGGTAVGPRHTNHMEGLLKCVLDTCSKILIRSGSPNLLADSRASRSVGAVSPIQATCYLVALLVHQVWPCPDCPLLIFNIQLRFHPRKTSLPPSHVPHRPGASLPRVPSANCEGSSIIICVLRLTPSLSD